MVDNELIEKDNNTLCFKKIKVKSIKNINNYLFIILDNGQKILLDGKEIYDISECNDVKDVFAMGDRLCSTLTKFTIPYVIDLKRKEILLDVGNVEWLSKQDEKTLYVATRGGNKRIYNIETRQYLPAPEDYDFESSLGNDFYVFSEQHDYNSDKSFYDYKRCVIDINGKILLENIQGRLYFSDNHFIIINDEGLRIVGANEETSLDIKTIIRNEKILAKPQYYNGNIVLIEKNAIKIFNPYLELLVESQVDDLTEVLDLELVNDTLKILIPYTVDGQEIGKHVFVNLKDGKTISHVRLEGYPYWTPATYIGHDSLDSEITEYHFYDSNFNKIVSLSANYYQNLEDSKECLFYVKSKISDETKKQFINTVSGLIKEVEYDYMCYNSFSPYGYGVNFSKGQMDFFDENLNIIIGNFDYEKYKLDFNWNNFSYFIVSDYICISISFEDDYERIAYRTIIQKSTGKIILDSIGCKCCAIGDAIQIMKNGECLFLNTKTGELDSLELSAPIDESGKINFAKLASLENILEFGNNIQLVISPSENSLEKIKTMQYPSTKVDD